MSEGDTARPPAKKGKQAIEEIYQKKSQLEHILLRPDTYIGSVEPVSENMWVYDTDLSKMTQRHITFVPGLYKIFDEILVNAADNKQRDKSMDCIRININPDNNEISVWNNGKGIPVQMHKDENMYVPTMIFGHLLTSSNYNDEEEKVTGGRNGYGAKLCNIFSSKFTVETSCKESRKRFKQTWVENMSKVANPKLVEASNEDFTKITFQPDLKKFKMDKLDKDIVDLMSRRAYDVAASTGGVKVFLNDKRVPVKNFKDYVDLVLKGHNDEIGNPVKVNYERVSDRWEVACCISDSGYQQISFVNSIATTKGGRHVDYVTDMLVKQLAEVIKKKNKGGVNVKPFQIKNHMWVFVNCLVVNPTFDSQTKENMTLQAKSFGSKCTLSDKFINAVVKSGITEAVISWAKFKAQSQLDKVGGKKKTKLKGVAKLEDANEAGSKNAHRCTLILTEGDSAKTLAVSGLGVVGRDYYGVFPLRGKLLNVREATHKQILDNAEINNMIKILGLQYKKKYNSPEDMKTLRYGKLMIMTDQDQDGSHIKGLLINFIHHNWPELLRQNFLEEFITPIVKVTKKDKSISFYSIPEFEEWRRDTPDNHTYNIKYYKGLGTSTSKEAKEYFEDMARHRIKFKYSGQADDNSIVMAFSKKCIDQRKEWLTNWMEECKRRREMDLPEVYLYEKETKSINFTDFVNKELVLFSNTDNERSIPNVMDGLKPGQRKVLFTCLKRNDKREVKVAQLAGSVAEHSAYHHGETSLMSTIINLAQNYVGSNNINLLLPNGQFGTRLQGGKDAASPRYIFTMLNPVTRHLFNPHDTPLLIQQKEDNQKIEPMWYCPIIPMVLVNGADGIGTGWMTKIPNYNPREIIANIKKMINGEEPTVMTPWYKGFTGHIESLGHQRYVVNGEVRILNDTKIEITELPIGVWTQNYKESQLEPMLYGNEKEKEKEKANTKEKGAKGKKKSVEEDDDKPAGKGGPVITDFKEYHTDTTVRFEVFLTEKMLERFENEGLHRTFKLQSTMTTTSMMLFDELGCMTKYNHVNEILQHFYKIRLDLYVKRKAYLLGMLRAEAKKLSNQARFIVEKCDGVISVENKKKRAMIEELLDKRYDSDPVKAWRKEVAKNLDEEEDDGKKSKDDEEEVEEGRDFDYILGMKLWTLTKEKKEALLNDRDKKLKEVRELEAKSPERLWLDDLDALSLALDEQEAKESDDKSYGKKGVAKVKGRKGVMAAETMPSPHGRRVVPVIDSELRKKIDKAVMLKEKQLVKKNVKEEGIDDFDAELGLDSNGLSLQAVIKNSPQEVEKKLNAKRKELKQTKLSFKPAATKKNKEFDSTDEDENMSGSDSFDAVLSATPDRPRDAPRRAAAAKAKFKLDSDDDEEELKSDSEFEDNVQMGEKPAPKKQALSSDDDSDFGGSKKKAKVSADLESSDVLFDKLIGGSSPEKPDRSSPTPPKKAPAKRVAAFTDSEDDFDEPPKKGPSKTKSDSDSDFGIVEEKVKPKKAAPKKKADEPKKKAPPKKKKPSMSGSESEEEKPKKKAPAKKKLAKPTSDSEDDLFDKVKPKKGSGGKKKKTSDDDLSDDSFGDVAPREKVAGGRSRKPISYKLESDDDSDF